MPEQIYFLIHQQVVDRTKWYGEPAPEMEETKSAIFSGPLQPSSIAWLRTAEDECAVKSSTDYSPGGFPADEVLKSTLVFFFVLLRKVLNGKRNLLTFDYGVSYFRDQNKSLIFAARNMQVTRRTKDAILAKYGKQVGAGYACS